MNRFGDLVIVCHSFATLCRTSNLKKNRAMIMGLPKSPTQLEVLYLSPQNLYLISLAIQIIPQLDAGKVNTLEQALM
jgi:hypothetical protein